MPREDGTVRRVARGGRLRLALAFLLALVPGLTACEETVSAGDPISAVVIVAGQVTDPSGGGVEEATVTFVFHETTACNSPEFARSSLETDAAGRFGGGAGLGEVSEGFVPKDVCMDVRAEPPFDRPELAPADTGGFVVTLRDGEFPPLDRVEVDLTLPEEAESPDAGR